MTRYFAYGSNMCRTHMAERCPGAMPLGTAKLGNWRFQIVTAGYASIVPAPGCVVHGVLWMLTPRDLAALNAYENIDSGLYVRRILPVRHGRRLEPAMTYVGQNSRPGRPRPAYQPILIAAARHWELPPAYIRMLAQYSCAPHWHSQNASQ